MAVLYAERHKYGVAHIQSMVTLYAKRHKYGVAHIHK